MEKHTHAKPSIEKIRKENPLIDPSKAQQLFSEGKIGKKDFICATDGCSAPITCRQIDKPNSTASFVEGRRKKNLHIANCTFKYRETKKTSDKTSVDPSFSVDFSDSYVGNSPRDKFVQGLGSSFSSAENPKTETVSDQEGNDTSTENTQTNKKNKDTNLPEKTYRKRLSTIERAVFLYENDQNLIIEDWFLGSHIPIRKYFRHIKTNHFQERIKDSVPIYYDRAFIVNTESSDYRINFSSRINIDGELYRPHFYVPKEFVHAFFPFLLKRVENNPTKPFRAYIRSRFALHDKRNVPGKKKLMFSHSDTELLNLIYFSDNY